MNVFVTGATGVIGRRVVPLLTAAGHTVTAVGRTPEKRAALERAGATATGVDLFDAAAVRAAVAGHDAVVNLATRIPGTNRAFLPGAWAENHRIRREVSANLAAAVLAGGAGRLVQESFAPMYADAGAAWITEGGRLDPPPHTRSALDAESAAARVTEGGGVGVALRFSFFYGPDGAFAEGTLGMARKGLASTFGRADGYLSSIHHDDAASAVVAALDVPAGLYNVTDDEPLTRLAHFDALAEALGMEPLRLLPAWVAKLLGSLGDTVSRSQRMSNAKFRGVSPWAPRYPSAREGWRAAVAELRGS